MIMLVYNEAMDLEVVEVLDQCAVKNYTKFVGVFGKGGTSGTHMGDDIWPGKNNALFIACDSESKTKLLDSIKELRKKLGKEGVKAFVMPLEEIT